MIGLARGSVKIEPYNCSWKEEYTKEEKILKSIIGYYVIDIQHVGSTSIEGLDSKPIIDIAIGVKSIADADKFTSLLVNEGYDLRGNAGCEGRIMFAKGSEELRTHYIHIEEVAGELWKNHICFRDYLRLNPKCIEEYSNLKKELASKFMEDRESYTEAKNQFISQILKKAKAEFER